jgi:hypothetical protein
MSLRAFFLTGSNRRGDAKQPCNVGLGVASVDRVAGGRRFANYVVSVIQAVFTWTLERQLVKEHTGQQVKVIPRPKSMPHANRPWT